MLERLGQGDPDLLSRVVSGLVDCKRQHDSYADGGYDDQRQPRAHRVDVDHRLGRMLAATRRHFLVSAIASVTAAACGRVTEPATRPALVSAPEFEAWKAQAYAMVNDSLQTLRTFEVFAAYRAAGVTQSDQRPPNTLAWDPPTGVAWDEAT